MRIEVQRIILKPGQQLRNALHSLHSLHVLQFVACAVCVQCNATERKTEWVGPGTRKREGSLCSHVLAGCTQTAHAPVDQRSAVAGTRPRRSAAANPRG